MFPIRRCKPWRRAPISGVNIDTRTVLDGVTDSTWKIVGCVGGAVGHSPARLWGVVPRRLVTEAQADTQRSRCLEEAPTYRSRNPASKRSTSGSVE